MNIVNTSVLGISLLLSTHIANAIDCTNPQGPANIITCLAQKHSMTPQQFWYTVLFSEVVLDGYCNPATVRPTLSTAQSQIFVLACQNTTWPGGASPLNYFSYDHFIAADAAIDAAAQSQGFTYTFLRSSNNDVNLMELANFLATAAQETTGNGIIQPKYQRDGLYFRYEVDYLSNNCYQYPANPNWPAQPRVALDGDVCINTPLNEYYTTYYPFSDFVVAVKNDSGTNPTQWQMYTPFIYYLDQKQDLTKSPMKITFTEKPTIIGGTLEPPAGTYWQFMNVMIYPGYWLGLGNLQLTKESMTQFFGWYEQHLVGAPVDYANFQDFVQNNYLVNGVTAWEGGIWFWNYRQAGWNTITVHDALTGSKAACHDIGLATYMVNGGCNNATTRAQYYTYYKTDVFKLPIAGVPFEFNQFKSNSMICTPELYSYCTGLIPTVQSSTPQ